MSYTSKSKKRFLSGAAIEAVENRLMLSTTYYVSPTGSDNNPGTSQAAPWQTVSKVNGTSFQPGDSILFQDGGQFHENLVPISSGTTAAPITFGAYGDSSLGNPLFFGSDPLDVASFNLVTGTTYSKATSTPVNWVFDNHKFTHESLDALNVAGSGTADPATNIAYVEANSGTFYYNPADTILYVNLGSPLAGHEITAATRSQVIQNNGNSNLVFKNLDVTECAADVNTYAFSIQAGTNITIDGGTASLTGKHAYGAINATGFVGKNLTADQTAPDLGFGGASAFVTFSDSTQTGNTSQWINDTYTHPNGAYEIFITHGDANSIASILLKNLVSENGYGTGMFCESTGPNEVITVQGGRFGGQLYIQTNNSVVDGVAFDQASGSVDISGDNAVVQNCVFTNLSPNISAGHNGGVILNGKNSIVRFNTFSFSGGPAVDLRVDNTNASVYGNVFDCDTPVWLAFNTTGTQSFDHNVFKPGSTFYDHDINSLITLSFQQWTALGYDSTSIVADPGFVDKAGGNYALSGTSPAIDFYTATPGVTVAAIDKDFAGSPRPFGGGYDAGAFELQTAKTVVSGTLAVTGTSIAAPLAGTSTTATFSVTLSSAQSAAETVQFATSDGTAVAGTDYTATSGTLTFAPGVTTQTVQVLVTPTLAANSSKTFSLTLSNPSTGIGLATASAAATVSNQTESTKTFDRKTPYLYTDAAGHHVTLKLGGVGTGTVLLNNSSAEPVQTLLTGTTAASSLVIQSAGGATSLNDVAVQGPLGAFTATTATLAGSLTFTGSVSRVSLGNVASTASINFGSASGRPAVKLGAVDGATVTSMAPIASLSAASWTADSSTSITAPSIGSLGVKGAFAADLILSGGLSAARLGNVTAGTWIVSGPAGSVSATSTAAAWSANFNVGLRSMTVAGNLSGNLTASSIGSLQVHGNVSNAALFLTGANLDLSVMKVTGSVTGSTLRSAGIINAVTVGSTSDSLFFAGVAPTVTTLPTSAGDFVTAGQINSFTIVQPKSAPIGFSNTQVAAATIGKVRVKGVQTANNGSPFGFATQHLTAFSDTEPGGKPFVWTSKQSPSELTFPGDFKVSIL